MVGKVFILRAKKKKKSLKLKSGLDSATYILYVVYVVFFMFNTNGIIRMKYYTRQQQATLETTTDDEIHTTTLANGSNGKRWLNVRQIADDVFVSKNETIEERHHRQENKDRAYSAIRTYDTIYRVVKKETKNKREKNEPTEKKQTLRRSNEFDGTHAVRSYGARGPV